MSGDPPSRAGLDAAGEHAGTASTAALQGKPDDGATAFIDKRGPTPWPGPAGLAGRRSDDSGGSGRIDHTGSSAQTVVHATRPGQNVQHGPDGPGGPAGPRAAPPPPPETPDRPRPRRPLIAIVTIVVLLASLVVVGVLVLRRPGTTPTAGPPPVTPVVPASAWRELHADPTPRQQVATTVADGTVWVIGGITDGAATPLVEGYDPAIDTWKTGIPLPVPLSHETAVTYRGEIIVLGGWQAQGGNLTAVSSNKVYAQRGGGWVELPPMLSPHVAGGAVVVGDEIIVSGGQDDGKLNPTTEVFDGKAWRRVADLPTPREHLGMATDGTYAYVVGGRDLSSDKNSAAVERYDPKADSWTALAPLPAPRGGIGAAVADGRLVVAGGEEPTTVDATVFAYDIPSNTWTDLPALPQRPARPRPGRGRQDGLRDRRRRPAQPHASTGRGRGVADAAAQAAARSGVARAEGRPDRAPVRRGRPWRAASCGSRAGSPRTRRRPRSTATTR